MTDKKKNCVGENLESLDIGKAYGSLCLYLDDDKYAEFLKLSTEDQLEAIRDGGTIELDDFSVNDYDNSGEVFGT